MFGSSFENPLTHGYQSEQRVADIWWHIKGNMAETQEELAIKVRELQKEVERLNAQLKEKRFGLSWIDVPEAFEQDSENRIPVLEEVPELAIHNKDGKPTHILIEGDNYHALTCLNYTHQGKIDIIYIDPPYNTGNDGFTYKDKRFLEEYPDGTAVPNNHPLRHSVWLSFMAKRLELAANLLTGKGVIFISIGTVELAQLTILCNEIFGESNQIAVIPRVQKRGNGKGTHFSPAVDFVLAYAKDIKQVDRFFAPNTADFPILEIEGPRAGEYYECSKSLYQGSLDSRPNQRYYIQCPDGSFIIPPGNNFPDTIGDGCFVVPADNEDKCWRWSKDSYLSQKHLLVFKKVKKPTLLNEYGRSSCWNVYTKRYQKDAEEKGKVPPNYIDDCINSLGTSRLNDIGITFSFSKPCELITKLIKFTNKKNDITVLDFFAGSGTTLDSVMQLNAETVKGNRQCILVTNNEDNICRDITYERNKRVIIGYTDSKGNDVAGLGNSLKYYRTAFVGKNQPKAASDDDKLALAKKAGSLLSLAENTLYETDVTDYYQIYNDEKGHWTCIYFQEDYSHFEEFHQKVSSLQGSEKSVYVFCWSDGAEFAAEFDYERDVTVKSIPQPILDIYKSLNA